LFDDSGNQVGTTTTDANGDYCFNNLVPGDYTVKETQPTGYNDVKEKEGGDDGDKSNNGELNSIDATVSLGETDSGNDFVEVKPGSLCGKVTEDTTGDGNGDTPISGVTLTLFDDSGSQVGTTTTDASGNYCFNNLVPGDYTVKETQPDKYKDISEAEGDIANSTTNAISTTISSGERDEGNDFVEIRDVFRIGDLFWIDDDRDGEYDPGEKTIGKAKVELLDEDGNVIATTETDENGRYHFDVPQGQYLVRFHIRPDLIDEGFAFVSTRKSGDDTNKVGMDGVVETPVEVGPGIATADLTLDAAISCGCDNAPIKANGGDAMGTVSMLLMMLMTFGVGLYFIRREERAGV
jgi:uncharacterized surface anchored protein